jgi:hypothetical protein
MTSRYAVHVTNPDATLQALRDDLQRFDDLPVLCGSESGLRAPLQSVALDYTARNPASRTLHCNHRMVSPAQD